MDDVAHMLRKRVKRFFYKSLTQEEISSAQKNYSNVPCWQRFVGGTIDGGRIEKRNVTCVLDAGYATGGSQSIDFTLDANA